MRETLWQKGSLLDNRVGPDPADDCWVLRDRTEEVVLETGEDREVREVRWMENNKNRRLIQVAPILN